MKSGILPVLGHHRVTFCQFSVTVLQGQFDIVPFILTVTVIQVQFDIVTFILTVTVIQGQFDIVTFILIVTVIQRQFDIVPFILIVTVIHRLSASIKKHQASTDLRLAQTEFSI